MLASTKLELRASEIKHRLIEIAGIEGELSDEVKAELPKLRTEAGDIELRFQAAKESENVREVENADTSEGREYRELRSKVGLNRYIEAATEKRAVSGPELEFNQALKIGAHKFPLEILSTIEERATTNVDTVTPPNRWLDRLFSVSAAARVGVTFESVAPRR